MFKMPSKNFYWIASMIIIFSLSFPTVGFLSGLLFISQNVSSLMTVILGVICGVLLSAFIPTIRNSFNYIFNLMNY